ncbi:MAG: alcohol dehydrogenase catalytic domain-containing protein [Chitinophagaceae bacterium]|nr:alcohol dehydrogenase catalytic domain-containing protein [Chitinophagaceae bacterium]
MRQAVLQEPGSVIMRDVPMPRPLKPNEILLKIHRVGVCGSDVHMYYGKHPFANTYPMVQGHEYGGEVVEVGTAVTLLKPGMKATARPHLVCGTCAPCLRGQYNVCQNLKVEGCAGPEGTAQEYFIIPEDRAVIIPNTLSYEQAAMIEPVAVGAHSTRRAGDLTGKNVVVTGAGTIGNLVAQFAVARGAKKVMITDLVDFKLDIARQCGVHATANLKNETFRQAIDRVFGKEGFQVGFEAVGVQSALTEVIGNVENGGTVIIIGVYVQNPVVDMGFLGEHELNVLGSMMYRHEDYLQAVDWIEKNKIQTAPLITQHFSLEEYHDAYKFIEGHTDKAVKVMIDVTEN